MDEIHERRVSPYSNTSQWDAKTFIALAALVFAIIGSILATWASLSNQITTLNVTQSLKFIEIENNVKSLQTETTNLRNQINSTDSSLSEMYNHINSNRK